MTTILFANTVYQLFLAINMRIQNVIEGEMDLVISNHTPSLCSYRQGLEQSRLFRKVFYVESLEYVKKFWKIPKEKQTEAFWTLSKTASHHAGIDYGQYDILFTANFNPYINGLYAQNHHLEVCFYEDGASVCAVDWRKDFQKYKKIPGFFDIFDHVAGLYINSPELMCVNLEWPIVQLPKIPRENEELRRYYNQIFGYDGSFHFPPFLFVEQSFPADQVINNDLDFIRAASEAVGYENFLVKPHPRNTVKRSVELGYSQNSTCVLPFELLLLNAKLGDTVFITVSSTSLISPWVLFGAKPKTILLYKAVTGGINIPAIDKYGEYLDKFVLEYGCRNLMIPKSMNEYKKLLNILAKKMPGGGI